MTLDTTYIINRVRATLAIALQSRFANSVTIGFNSRLTRTIGWAVIRYSDDEIVGAKIEFSTHIVPHLTREQLDELIDHECAHIVAVERYGQTAHGHGAEWKMVMGQLGHSNPSAETEIPNIPHLGRKVKRHVTVCSLEGVEILVTPYMAGNIRNYRCASCKADLLLTDEVVRVHA